MCEATLIAMPLGLYRVAINYSHFKHTYKTKYERD